MGCFQQTFKDIKQLNDPSFHNTLITLFFRPVSILNDFISRAFLKWLPKISQDLINVI